MSLESENYSERSINKFEAMLQTNDVYFFDAEDFEVIITHYLNVGRVNLASKACQMGLKQHPNSTELRLLHVEILVFKDSYDQAYQILDELQTLDPENEEIFIQRAHIFSRKEQHLQAIDCLKQALAFTEDPIELYSLLGMEHLFMDDYQGAIPYFAKCLEDDPEDHASLYNIVSCYQNLHQSENAIVVLSKLLENSPYNPLAWSQLGKIYLEDQKFEEAITAFDFAIISDELMLTAYLDKGNALKELSRFNEAIDSYNEYISIYHEDAEPFCRIADCHEQMGNYELALKYYELAIKKDPTHADSWEGLIFVLLENNRDLEALEKINKALDINHKNAYLWAVCMDVHEKLGDHEMALYAAEEALNCEDEALRYEDVLRLSLLTGDIHKTISILQNALELFPDYNGWMVYRCLIEIRNKSWIMAKHHLILLAETDELLEELKGLATEDENQWINDTLQSLN